MNISEIPTSELQRDLADANESVAICAVALAQGITHHKDGLSVRYRHDTDRKIIAAIEAELKRREGADHA